MRGAWAIAGLLALTGPAAAQEPPPPATGPVATPSRAPLAVPVVVLRQGEFFEKSAFGLASRARREEAARALIAENREIEAQLDAEERALTDRRTTLPPAEFRPLAEAFNVKVEGIRASQEAKSQAIQRMLDEDRQRFLQAAVPVVAELMVDLGAVAVLDQSVVILSLDVADITDMAIERVDAKIGAGDLTPAQDDEAEDGQPREVRPPAP